MGTKETPKGKCRIGELAKRIGVETFVVRFWEKEFNLRPTRSPGGQRFYSKRDELILVKIKDLLYCKKFTIPGAKKALTHATDKGKTPKAAQVPHSALPKQLVSKLNALSQELRKLRSML